MKFAATHFWGIILGIVIAEVHRKTMGKKGG